MFIWKLTPDIIFDFFIPNEFEVVEEIVNSDIDYQEALLKTYHYRPFSVG